MEGDHSVRPLRLPEVVRSAGMLIDMDGTIIDSTNAIVKYCAWSWASSSSAAEFCDVYLLAQQLGVDPDTILRSSHGRRTIDVLREFDDRLANWEYVSHIEGEVPKQYGQDAVEIPGSRALLAQLQDASAPWMIVTSGTRALVNGWLDVMKLAHPKSLVVAEDVTNGKPDPECYLLGRARLGLEEDSSVLVLEDSPAGVKAGRAAGFSVVALATTHEVGQLKEAGADWIVQDMKSVSLKRYDQKTRSVEVEIYPLLRR